LTVARNKPIKHDSRFSEIDLPLLTDALELLTHSMPLFQQSGGCHGTALFSVDGSIDHVSEDIGRHNAVDKTIGKAILSKSTIFEHSMLLLSGRCGWDIVAKCVRVGIPAIASLGAFSSAAVNLAREHNVTLYGFVTDRGAWKVGY
jgi:FdhD protein